MELLPEETTKINFSEYRSRIADIAPNTKGFIYQCNGWREFFAKAIDVLEWNDYKNLIKDLLQSGQPPLILITVDFLVLPSPVGESYNDIWHRKYWEYRNKKDEIDSELEFLRKQEKDAYTANCSKYKEEFMNNIKKYNEDYESNLMSDVDFCNQRDKAHDTYTLLCTEEYNKMNNELMVVESDYILEQYNFWKTIQDQLVQWLLANLV